MIRGSVLCSFLLCATLVRADEVCDMPVQMTGVDYVTVNGDGGVAEDSIIYDNVMSGPYYTTSSAPRWHCGEPASFVPGPGAGKTNILVTGMVVTVGNNSGSPQISDINVQFWDTFDPNPGTGQSVNSDPLGGFTLADPTPLDTGFVRFYFVDLTVLTGGGILLPDDEWFIELTYFEPGTTNPQLSVSPVFNAGPDADSSGAGDGPTVGSSDDFFYRDSNGNGKLVKGERASFSIVNLANFAIQISANLCQPCDANCDGSVNQFDIQPFINTIVSHSGCNACAGDTDGNGTANAFDINGFLACLIP